MMNECDFCHGMCKCFLRQKNVFGKCNNCGEVYLKNLSVHVCDKCFPLVVNNRKIIAQPRV